LGRDKRHRAFRRDKTQHAFPMNSAPSDPALLDVPAAPAPTNIRDAIGEAWRIFTRWEEAGQPRDGESLRALVHVFKEGERCVRNIFSAEPPAVPVGSPQGEIFGQDVLKLCRIMAIELDRSGLRCVKRRFEEIIGVCRQAQIFVELLAGDRSIFARELGGYETQPLDVGNGRLVTFVRIRRARHRRYQFVVTEAAAPAAPVVPAPGAPPGPGIAEI
jgi:hypothetical protein